jgi:hypothetical protein
MIDLLSFVDVAIIGSIMAIMEVLKSADDKGKFSRLYPLFVLILGVTAALFKTVPLSWQAFGNNAIIYVGASSFIYKFGKTTVMGK